MSSDRTPADVIAEAAIGQTWDEDSPGAILDALTAAGFRLTPIPDDNTRAEVGRFVREHRAAANHTDAVTAAYKLKVADLLAAAYLDGQPEDRPATCPTCGRKAPGYLLGYLREGWGPVKKCSDAWHVGGSGDTR